jgi:hypothetical protein
MFRMVPTSVDGHSASGLTHHETNGPRVLLRFGHESSEPGQNVVGNAIRLAQVNEQFPEVTLDVQKPLENLIGRPAVRLAVGDGMERVGNDAAGSDHFSAKLPCVVQETHRAVNPRVGKRALRASVN